MGFCLKRYLPIIFSVCCQIGLFFNIYSSVETRGGFEGFLVKTHCFKMVNSYLLLKKVDNKITHDFEPVLKSTGAEQSLDIFGSVRKSFEIIGNCRKMAETP